MNMYKVILAVAHAAVFDTGRRIEMLVSARSPLDAALLSERTADRGLDDELEYTHARRVYPVPVDAPAAAMPLAA